MEQTIDPSGANLRTSWDYYTNSGTSNYRELKQVVRPNGYWEIYQYDSKFFITNILSGYLNATNGSNPSDCREVSLLVSNTTSEVTAITKVLGTEVGRTIDIYTGNKQIHLVTQTAGATSIANNNLESIIERYDTDTDYPGEMKTEKRPDGTMVFYEYSITSSQKTTTIYTGQTNSSGTGILNGTKKVTTVGMMGERLAEYSYDYTNGVQGVLISSQTYAYSPTDYFKESPTVTYLDGTTSQLNHGCCTLDSEVDRDGIYTFYGYDSLKRRISTTRNGITVSNVLDGAGNVVKSVRIGSDDGHSEIMLSQTGYDVAGRVTSETNALGGVTRYGYFLRCIRPIL